MSATLELLAPPPAPRPHQLQAPQAPWLTIELLVRLAVSAFFLLQNPSQSRLATVTLGAVLHLLEASGLGLALLLAVKSLVLSCFGAPLGPAGGGRARLLQGVAGLEGWLAAGCPVPAAPERANPLQSAAVLLQALVFSLAPRWTVDGLPPIA